MADDKGPLVLGIAAGVWGLAVVVVGIRMYSRRVLTRHYGADDTLILIALTFASGDFALKLIWCLNGLGKHINEVSHADLQRFVQIAYALSVQYTWSLGFVKLSILSLYRRIFPSRRFHQATTWMSAFVACVTLSMSLGQAFSCTPTKASYTMKKIPNAHCVNKVALQFSGNLLNLLTDVAVLLLPMKYLWALTVNPRRRYSVLALFFAGLLSCIASIMRLTTIYGFYATKDPTWDSYPIAIWSAIETNVPITTCSLLASKAFLDKFIFSHIEAHFPHLWPTMSERRLSVGFHTFGFNILSSRKSSIARPPKAAHVAREAIYESTGHSMIDEAEFDFHNIVRGIFTADYKIQKAEQPITEVPRSFSVGTRKSVVHFADEVEPTEEHSEKHQPA